MKIIDEVNWKKLIENLSHLPSFYDLNTSRVLDLKTDMQAFVKPLWVVIIILTKAD